MANTSSDDDNMFITQNVFSQTKSDENVDVIHEFLFGEGELELPDEKQSPLPKVNKEKTKRVVVVSDGELEKRNVERIPKGTRHNTNWAVSVWKEWAEIRNGEATRRENDLFTFVEPDILNLHNNDEINYWLAKFVVEIRKKKPCGEPYPPNSLYQLCCGIQRYFRENGKADLNLFENSCFKKFHDSLDSEMKRLTTLGYGIDVRQAEAFTEEQEEKLWSLKLLGDYSAKVLLDTMVFLIGRNFALRSGKEHRNLRFEQFTLIEASGGEPEKLVFNSFGEKNNQGGLKHRSIKPKKIEHYANEDVVERCLVKVYKKYVARCPTGVSGSFYLAPKRKINDGDEGKSGNLVTHVKLENLGIFLTTIFFRFGVLVWFTRNPVGHNPLGQTVRRLCEAAAIKGHFTNHSLRATTATRGLAKGIPQKYVMERTGHRDVRSLQRYERPDIKTKIGISKCLDGGNNSYFKLEPSRGVNEKDVGSAVKRNREECSVKDEQPPCVIEEKKARQSVAQLEMKERGYFDNCTFNFN